MPIRVVLVDDAEDVRRLLRTALRFRGGFEVVGESADGAGAVRQARNHRPDVIVLDLGLPDLAGREVLRRIRAVSPTTRIVVFTGTQTDDRAWMSREVEGFALKDEDLDYLVSLLESVGRQRGDQAVLPLTRDTINIRRARRFTTDIVEAWRLTDLLDDALIVVTELATNAITHAGSICELRLSRTAATLRIEVTDESPASPEPQPGNLTGEHGRGLHLVATLATAWGVEAIPNDGKVVWAELTRRPADSPATA